MLRRRLFIKGFSALLPFALSIVFAQVAVGQEWEFRVKPKGTLRIVDFYVPSTTPWVNIAEGLVGIDKDFNYIPCLARDWRWIDDRTIEFRIREGVQFQNGEKFNAEALRINWDAYKKMEQPRFFRFSVLSDETSLKIIDNYTVRFTFPKRDNLALLKLRWFFQIAPSYLAKHQFPEKNWARLSEGGPWGTGPFKLVEGSVLYGKPSAQIVLEANEDYWDERYPKIKRVVFDNSLLGDREEAVNLCMDQEGKVDIVTFIRPLDTLKVAESRYAKVVKNRTSSGLVGISTNIKKTANGRTFV
jgi:peptide/nickel transport system substrate-binding protein